MKIGYRAGFKDGKEEGYQQGWEECQEKLSVQWQRDGYLTACHLAYSALLAADGAEGVAEVMRELEEVLPR